MGRSSFAVMGHPLTCEGLVRASVMKPVFLRSYAVRAILLLIISIVPLTFGPSSAVADDAITLSQLLNAWRNRVQRVKSFRFQWTEDHFQAKGSLALPPDPQYKGLVFPPRDTTSRVKSS